MIGEQLHTEDTSTSTEMEKYFEEMEKERESFSFIKVEFMVDMRAAERRYKEDYKNDTGGTRYGQLSFNQWLDCKKFDATKFYTKHSDYYL
jgi:hypothetical protein